MSEESVLTSELDDCDIRELSGLPSWPTKINLLCSKVQIILSRKQRPQVGFFKSQPFFLDRQLTQPLVVRTPCIVLVVSRIGVC